MKAMIKRCFCVRPGQIAILKLKIFEIKKAARENLLFFVLCKRRLLFISVYAGAQRRKGDFYEL